MLKTLKKAITRKKKKRIFDLNVLVFISKYPLLPGFHKTGKANSRERHLFCQIAALDSGLPQSIHRLWFQRGWAGTVTTVFSACATLILSALSHFLIISLE
jgi:hypothetical protein